MRNKPNKISYFTVSIILLIVFVWSLSTGETAIGLNEVVNYTFGNTNTSTANLIIHDIKSPELDKTIVFIDSADPGYDWLFSIDIKGLVTQYGGVNSHMAIRAAERGIPAAIGIGEYHMQKIAKSSVIEIDCSNKILRPVE